VFTHIARRYRKKKKDLVRRRRSQGKREERSKHLSGIVAVENSEGLPSRMIRLPPYSEDRTAKKHNTVAGGTQEKNSNLQYSVAKAKDQRHQFEQGWIEAKVILLEGRADLTTLSLYRGNFSGLRKRWTRLLLSSRGKNSKSVESAGGVKNQGNRLGQVGLGREKETRTKRAQTTTGEEEKIYYSKGKVQSFPGLSSIDVEQRPGKPIGDGCDVKSRREGATIRISWRESP